VNRDRFTIRTPKGLLDRVREQAEAYGDSMNDLVVSAIQKEVNMREQLRLLTDMQKARRKMEACGVHPDSTQLIRQMRNGAGRHE